jgi:TRAP-type transport system periplasmic protein
MFSLDVYRRPVARIAQSLTALALVLGLVQTAAAQEVVLRAITYAPPDAYEESIVIFKEYVDRVNARAEGRLRIDYVGGPEVVGVRDQMGALRDGVVDMVVTFTAHESLVPEVGAVGLSRITPAEERENGFFDIIDEAHAHVGARAIGRVSTQSGFFIFSREKIDSLDDFEGLRIRSHSGYDAFFEALGAVPIHMQIAEIYPALERGLVDAAPYPLFVHSLGIHEVADYALADAFWPAHTTWTYINAAKFDSLSEDLRQILTDTQIELEQEMPGIVQDMQAEERRKLEEGGIEFVSLSDADLEVFRRTADESRWEALSKTLNEETHSRLRSLIAPDL